MNWPDLSVVPSPSFTQDRLVALEDEDGFALALGIVTGIDRSRHRVQLLTRLTSIEHVETLHIGDLLVDPNTFQDTRLGSRGG